jgi:hypothetical protein
VEEVEQSFSNMGGNVAKDFHGGSKTQLLATHD